VLVSAVSALRAWFVSIPALLALAAIAGVAASVWPVALAPAVASVTTEKIRPRAFSLVFSSGIAIGIFGGIAAGRLPSWIAQLHGSTSNVASYRASLLVGCAIVLLAVWPLWRTELNAPRSPARRKLDRPRPQVFRFLLAMAIWQMGTGLFNPFRNVFFAKHVRTPVEQIGYLFSSAQAVQVAAILLAPIALKKFGLLKGVSGMQMATALLLLVLAPSTGLIAAVAYCGFMAAQYMSEPGLFSFLMDSTPAEERNSAAALNFLVSFTAQALAAAFAGVLLSRFGYPPVLTLAAIICMLAALMFRNLLKPAPSSSS